MGTNGYPLYTSPNLYLPAYLSFRADAVILYSMVSFLVVG